MRCARGLVLAACLLVTGEVVRVVDGDTFDMRAQVWLNVTVTERVRVLGVDAKEAREPGGAEATAFARAWLEKGPVRVRACGRDSFGRVLGIVTNASGETLADALKAAGHAKP